MIQVKIQEIVKLQEKEVKIYKARPIEDRILQNLNQA